MKLLKKKKYKKTISENEKRLRRNARIIKKEQRALGK